MGISQAWNNIKSVFLSEQNREQIWRQFGSFQANQFGLTQSDIIANSYEKNVDVYAVIKKIVDVTKSVDWIVEEKLRDGTWIKLEDTTIHELMKNPNVNKGYTWNDIEEQLLTYLIVSGNGYLYGERPFASNLIGEVDVLPSNHICIESNNDFFLPQVKFQFRLGTTYRNLTYNDLCHVKFFNPSYTTVQESMYGLSAIQVACKVIQTGNDRWDADANLLQNRGAIGLITDKSQRPMTPEEAAVVQGAWDRDNSGTRNFGKIKVTNKDLNYIQMAMSSADLQLIEKGVINLRAICNVFGLDSSLFNDPENKTYSNRTEAEKSLFTNAVMPISDKLSEHFTRFLCANHFPNRTVRMRQDFSNIEVLQENFKEKSDIYLGLKNAGIVTANEVRTALNIALSEEENANELLISNSLTLLDNLKENEKNI